MRKHDVRKWLHAILDLLPVLLIPVFMIYSHRHDISSESSYVVETPIYYETNDVTSSNDLIDGNYYTISYLNGNSDISSTVSYYYEYNVISYGWSSSNTLSQLSKFIIFLSHDRATIQFGTSNDTVNLYQAYVIDFRYMENQENNLTFLIENNLITSCPRQYINYIETTTYNFDKDIMGAFMNNFNFTIDKYFNMGNVFNLNGVYQWFNTNIFSGNAPTIIYSIWNIALYELVMDLLFLLYGLFMWFIDMVQTLMDKPFKSIK